MTLETTLAALAACNIEPKGSLSHAPTTTDPASWKSAIQEAPSHVATVPSEYKLTKTLVFKPKTAKSAVPIPLILIAAEDTDTKATNALGKQLNLKELRLASDDLIKEIFGAEKNTRKCSFDCVYIAIIELLYTDLHLHSVSPLSLDAELFPKVVTVLDSNIASSSSIFAVRPRTNEATIFLIGSDIHAYLQSIDAESKLHVVDFASLASEVVGASGAPGTTAKATAPTKKIEARIEDAHQLAIGVKKEVDFATWYTNVGNLT